MYLSSLNGVMYDYYEIKVEFSKNKTICKLLLTIIMKSFKLYVFF